MRWPTAWHSITARCGKLPTNEVLSRRVGFATIRMMKISILPKPAWLVLIAVFAVFSCNAPEEVEEQTIQDVMPQEVLVTDFASLAGSEWKLADLCGEAVAEDAGMTLSFLEEGRVAGGASVNRYNGPFLLADDGVEAGPFATTRMAGPPEAMERERAYLAALAAAKSVSTIGGDQLVIAVDGRELPLRFEVVESP